MTKAIKIAIIAATATHLSKNSNKSEKKIRKKEQQNTLEQTNYFFSFTRCMLHVQLKTKNATLNLPSLKIK